MNQRLKECNAELTNVIDEIVERYDFRDVLVVLGARFAEVGAAAMATGVERCFVAGVVGGTLERLYTPPKKAPESSYIDDDQVLERKH